MPSILSRHARSSRPFIAVVAAFLSVPLSCLPVMAGTITYTWIEDDGQPIAGQLLVNSSAQAAGQISPSDIISFNWTGLFDTYTTAPPLSPDPLPISTLDAGFTGSPPAHLGNVSGSGDNLLAFVDANSNYQVSSSQSWAEGQLDQFFVGLGHWSVSAPSTVPIPEPSTLVISSIMFGMFGVVWSYKLWKGTKVAA